MLEHELRVESVLEPPKTTQHRAIGHPVDHPSRSVELIPIPRLRLKSLESIRTEMARVYRAMKAGQIDTADGTKLTYVLSQLAKLVIEADVERRLQALEMGVVRGKP